MEGRDRLKKAGHRVFEVRVACFGEALRQAQGERGVVGCRALAFGIAWSHRAYPLAYPAYPLSHTAYPPAYTVYPLSYTAYPPFHTAYPLFPIKDSIVHCRVSMSGV